MSRRVIVEAAPNYSNSLGITSIILGVVSLPFLCMPCIGYVGVGIGCIGMLLGGIGLIQSLGRGGHGIGFPIGGMTLCFMSALVGVLMMTVLAGMIALPWASKKATDDMNKVKEREALEKEAQQHKPDAEPKSSDQPEAKADPKPARIELPVDGRKEAERKALFARLASGLDAVESAALKKFGKVPMRGEDGFTAYNNFLTKERDKVFSDLSVNDDLSFAQAQRLLKEGESKNWPRK